MTEDPSGGIEIRQLREDDLPAAGRIFREAFAAEYGLADPEQFAPGADLIGFRWRTNRAGTWAAVRDGELLGSNVATAWGSVGIFGPLTVSTQAWNAGIGQQLVRAAVDWLEGAGCAHLVLFTLSSSPKHVALYRRFGYHPRFLTALMAKQVDGSPAGDDADTVGFSALAGADRTAALSAARDLTDTVYEGLDVGIEMTSLASQSAGETLLIMRDGALEAFAVCHVGEGSEAVTGTAFLKFAAARPGRGASTRLDRLLAACEAYASARGAKRLIAGTNLARRGAWRALERRGYRTTTLGVAMHRPNRAAYDRPGAYVIDDWR